MEVKLVVKHGTNISLIEREYPDIYLDDNTESEDCYFIGKSMEDTSLADNGQEIEWLTHQEAVECCGFCEGAVVGMETVIEGNGGWAQGMISRKDFTGLAVDGNAKKEYSRTSRQYWKAHKRGEQARLAVTVTNS